MRRRTALMTAPAFALTIAAGGAFAAPFSSPDPRSFAMGGTGVAAGTSANAIFMNPALLAVKRDRDRFSLELPIVGGRLLEQGGIIDAIEDFDSFNPIARFDAALNAFNTGDMDAVREELIAAGTDLDSRLRSISDKVLQVEGNAAVVVGVPGERLGVSVFVNAHVVGGVLGNYSEADRGAIEQVIAAAEGSDTIPSPVDGFTSSMRAGFALMSEFGVSVARGFDELGGISIGVTPKLVKVQTYDYAFSGSELDQITIDLDQGERSDSDLNFDAGVAKDFGLGWQAGLTVRNLIPREYTTAAGNKFKLDPMVRAGVVHRPPFISWVTFAADLDLTENRPAGLDSKTQYLGLGVEFDAMRTLQLRLGYRHNFSSLPSGLDSGMYSAGFGFSPFGVHFDAALAGNSDEIGAALQLGFRF
jgi:hypothetical protein